MKKLTYKDELDIVNEYTTQLTTMIELAARHKRTRQTIWNVLKRHGVDTSKRRVPVSCACCGEELLRHKSRIRKTNHSFCSKDCYYAWINAGGDYRYSRQGMRVGRHVVSKYFDLAPGNIVHHKDKNNFNNEKNNLAVFKNQGDHIRHHRGFPVDPIWDGSDS
jgi:hypothetical protein